MLGKALKLPSLGHLGKVSRPLCVDKELEASLTIAFLRYATGRLFKCLYIKRDVPRLSIQFGRSLQVSRDLLQIAGAPCFIAAIIIFRRGLRITSACGSAIVRGRLSAVAVAVAMVRIARRRQVLVVPVAHDVDVIDRHAVPFSGQL